jgi:hypothetical protein
VSRSGVVCSIDAQRHRAVCRQGVEQTLLAFATGAREHVRRFGCCRAPQSDAIQIDLSRAETPASSAISSIVTLRKPRVANSVSAIRSYSSNSASRRRCHLEIPGISDTGTFCIFLRRACTSCGDHGVSEHQRHQTPIHGFGLGAG